VSVQYGGEDQSFREVLDLDDDQQRNRLASIVRDERCVRLHSQEFNFHDVFLKLTGQAYT
jgi:hypothetical protein